MPVVRSPRKRRRRSGGLLNIVIILLVVLVLLVVGLFIAGRLRPAATQADASVAVQEAEGAEAVDTAETASTSEEADTEKPVAPAEPEPEPDPVITVCIDAGHGGKDPGCGTEGNYEKDDVLELALALRDAMEAQGINVVMTREDDTFIELKERPEIANKAKADYMISIHRNSLESGSAKGVEVWRSCNAGEESISFAETISAKLEGVGVSRNRGVSVGSRNNPDVDNVIYRLSKMPAVIVEMGFVTSEEDNKLFKKNMNAYAQALAEAVLETYDQYHGEDAGETDTADNSAE